MHPCSPVRSFLYYFLFACSTILLGLTAYRVHYTKGLKHGDILTTSTHFYDAIIVELIVTSCLAIMFTLWLGTVAVIPGFGGGAATFMSEHVMMWIVWVMFLVGAAITTHRWHNLKWCRGAHKECRILETIKAFSWICWGFATFVILASIIHMVVQKLPFNGHIAGSETTGYETRQREDRPTATVQGVQNTAPNPTPAAV